MLSDYRVRSVIVQDTDPWRWKTAFALLVGTGQSVSFQSYKYFSEVGAHRADFRMFGRYEERIKLLVSYEYRMASISLQMLIWKSI